MVHTLFTVSHSVAIDGPLSVWNGQEELARISNDAGEWDHGEQGGFLENMFDGNPDTFWHSDSNTVYKAKTIKIQFKVNENGEFELFNANCLRKLNICFIAYVVNM